MHTTMPPRASDTPFELRFDSLFQAGQALAFPCDRHGRVDLDALGERARCNYFLARATVGRHYMVPAVCVRPLVHPGSAAWTN
ncbi:MAG: hypothetical protein KIT17_17650 [Rubrivivax sp.]|nr:hypothetical protein [Rubrivivax sp.]